MAVLGYNTIGATSGTIIRWWACKFTATEAGTTDDINCYFAGLITVNYKMVIWADNAGVPGAQLAVSAQGSKNTTPGWETQSITYSFADNEVLWLGFIAEDWCDSWWDTNGTTNQQTEMNEDYTGYPTVPNPPTVNQQNDLNMSIYLNYTPSTGNTTNFFQFF